MSKLTPKQQRFVEEYLIDLNATKAAVRAGYAQPNKQGPRMLVNVGIAAAIRKAMDERSERTGIDQDWVLNNLRSITERCMQVEPVTDSKGDPVLVENAAGGIVPAFTFNSTGANRALELIGKHLGMFVERKEHTGKDGGPIQYENIDVEEARKRAAEQFAEYTGD